MSESKNLTKKELKKKSKKELIKMLLEYDIDLTLAFDLVSEYRHEVDRLDTERSDAQHKKFNQKLDRELLKGITDAEYPRIDNIDKVNVTNLDLALRMVGITFDDQTIDKIIDLVELIEIKGDDVTIKDICDLQAEWEGSEIDWDGLMNTSTT